VQDTYNQSIRDGSTVKLDRELNATSAAMPSLSGTRIGDYVVSFGRVSTGLNVFRRPGPGELPPTSDGKIQMYRTTFYPSATRASEATIVTLKAGEDRAGVDVQLRPVIGARVSGRVIGPDGPQALMGLKLLPTGFEQFTNDGGMMNPVTLTDAAGNFAFLGVPPGQYQLRAVRQPPPVERTPTTPPGFLPIPAEPTLWADMPLTVSEQDMKDVVVTLSRGIRVSGRLEFDGNATRPAPERLQMLAIDITASDNRAGVYGALGVDTPLIGRVDRDGTFTTYGLPAGRYLLSADNVPAPWKFKAALVNGKDISSFPFELRDRDIDSVVITLTDRPTRLSGSVHTDDGKPDATADVMVFTTDKTGWAETGSRSRRVQLARTGRTGRYTITDLPPGEYFAVAIPDERSVNITDAKMLQSLAASAVRIQIGDAGDVTQDLQTLRIK